MADDRRRSLDDRGLKTEYSNSCNTRWAISSDPFYVILIMLYKLSIAFSLMAFCVLLNALALTAAVNWLARRWSSLHKSFASDLMMLILVAAWIVVTHLTAISVWGLYYAWQQLLPDVQTAFYFSAVTYTTTGYGDYTLPKEWHMLSSIQALTGILMCGLSAGFFFAVVNSIFANKRNTKIISDE